MPALGWLLGSQFAHYVTRFAPWIAFVLLALSLIHISFGRYEHGKTSLMLVNIV